MDRIESFEAPTPISVDDESPIGATTTDEPPAVGESDSFEQSPGIGSLWSGGGSSSGSFGSVLGELREKLGPATSALSLINTAQANSGQLDLGFGAIGKLAGPLSKLAGMLGFTEGATRIPQATSQLELAWQAYQASPSKENAQKLEAAFEGWRAAAQPLVERIPVAPVAAQLGGMLEIASKTSGKMSVVFSERSERAADASREDGGRAEGADEPPVDPRLAANDAEIAAAVGQDAAVPDYAEIPAELDRKLEAWRSHNGLRALPARLEAARERILDLHRSLDSVRDERSHSWSPSKRAALGAEETRLSRQLREALGNLEASASASAPDSGRFLVLENLKQAL